ncbi:uncharacterized protein TRIVIDRAFT_225772 [Trichoderma virens Gv29-8]|uniref:Uncharacterized protein n=1 Tax=Hypocrea virens (strain Gv29-8 / FGSC 10586) TaxID=413071 RepID=G9N4D9_HYPVG|nr:uncharacterized protein TRIVIDRAFT_225772 [Trichoderma virens Gv29-8]EHK18464.1 hypothetical protein TRIVIDRAFT_225772 [Trichoderma virens Gv29-8]
MKRPLTGCHSAYNEARPPKTRQRPSSIQMTWPSTITEVDNDVESSVARHQDSCPDSYSLPHAEPKETLYLNSRAKELSQRVITEPNPLAVFKDGNDAEDAVTVAHLIFQHAKSPARFVEEVFRSIFVPDMRRFFTKEIRKRFREHQRSGSLSDSQEEKLRNAEVRLDDWDTSSHTSSGPFSLKRFSELIEAINNAMDETPTQKGEMIAKDELNQDKYADQIIWALNHSYSCSDRALRTFQMTWLGVLRPVFRMTAKTEIPEAHEEQWRDYIGSALKENHIDWILGRSNSYLTATIAQRVVSNEETQERIISMSSIAHSHKNKWFKDRGECIDFGCKFPLKSGLPADVVRGFAQLQENTNFGRSPNKPGLINHYKKALNLLEEFQAEPHVELLCILALTIGMTSDMTIYTVPKKGVKDEVAGFAIASKSVKHKRGGTRVALLALRMLWYLMPDKFVWKKAKGEDLKIEEETIYSTQSVREATDQYMITNNMVAALGWFDYRKNNTYTISTELKIARKEVLDARLEELRSLMPKPTDFIRAVFQSDDPKWVDQCKAIIK